MTNDARDDLIAVLADYPNAISHEDAEARVEAHADEVRAEHTTVFVRWLYKKAAEYRSVGGTAAERRQRAVPAEAIELLADKARRGAVRPNNLLLPAGQAPAPQLDDQPMTRFGPQVQGRCPACGLASLFVGSGGYVTCGNLPCPEPDAASTLLERRTAPQPETAPDAEEPFPAALRAAGLPPEEVRAVAIAPDAEPGTPDDDRERLRAAYAELLYDIAGLAPAVVGDPAELISDLLAVRDDALTTAQRRVEKLAKQVEDYRASRKRWMEAAFADRHTANDACRRRDAAEQRITADAIATALTTWPEAGAYLHDLGHETVRCGLSEHLAAALGTALAQDGGGES